MKSPPWLLAVPGTLEVGHTVTIDPAEGRHLTGSLRRRTGDEIVLADGEGRVAGARVFTVERGRVQAEVLSVHRESAPAPDGVTVALAMLSGPHMDWAVQKAVEIGVQRFVPIVSERAQIRKRGDGARIDHWLKISMQALKQCRRPWAMTIGEIVSLPDFVAGESKAGGGIVASRMGSSLGELPGGFGQILVVGPEGGFSAEEDDLFDRYGWPRLCLGPHVLRAETAAVVGGAMMVARVRR